ncbi:MAG: type IX secretion system membrane protein PorP/SprF [Saprospiraceae bacterium]|nr:type IX secretion system membrane protein PorP/SprF [Saprospiraceae bacterium]
MKQLVKVICLCLVYCFSMDLFAQQTGLNPMYYLDSYLSNQARAGLDGIKILSLSYRDQWAKNNYSPNNFNLNFNSPLRLINGAYGMSLNNRTSGILSQFNFKTSYNQIFTRKNYLLSISLGAYYDRFRVDYAGIRTPEGSYFGNLFNHNDPLLANSELVQHALGASSAIYLQTKQVEFGIEYSRPLFHFNSIGRDFFKAEQLLKTVLYKELKVEQWIISSTIFHLTDFKNHQVEIKLEAGYNNLYTGGVYWRGITQNALDAFGINFSFRLIDRLWLSYACEWALRSIKNDNFGISQQFGLRMEFKARNPESKYPIIYNPRW